MSPRISDLYLRSQSDTRLLSLTRDGHARAFAILVERYRPELLARARRLGAAGGAEDVVQQTFLNAYAALTGGAEVGHLRGWLHAILRNVATRAYGPVEAPLEGSDVCGEPLEAVIERRARARSVISALADLPSRQRHALLGSSLQGLTRAELASSLGVSEAAVRQLVHRARRTLRSAVTALTPYPLARWLAAGPAAGVGTDVAVSAGAASLGGVLAKVGVFAAVGALATGVAVQTHHGTHPAPAHRGTAPRNTVLQSQRRRTAKVSTTPSASRVREYATDDRAAVSAGIGGSHRSGDGASHSVAGERGRGGDRSPARSGPGSGTGSGPGSGRGSGSGSGSGRGSNSGSGRGPGSDSGGPATSGHGPSPDSGPASSSGSGSNSSSGPGPSTTSGSGPGTTSGPGPSTTSGSGPSTDSGSGSSGDTDSDRSSGAGTASDGTNGSPTSPSSSGVTGSSSGSDSGSDSGTSANGGSGSGSGKDSRDLQP
jgi:RNA polymerase sigma factor (sigma-70 family)